MARHCIRSIDFKRQVVQGYLAGETLHGVVRRHDLSRHLVGLCIHKFEAGAFNDVSVAAASFGSLRGQDRRLERLVGGQALGIEFVKGALKNGQRSRNTTTSVITSPVISPSPTGAG